MKLTEYKEKKMKDPEFKKTYEKMKNDLISRRAAIEELHTWFRDGFDEDKWWNSTHVLAAIEELPSEPRWIPVTERLPERGEKVLVSTEKTVFVQVFKGIYRTPNRWMWEHGSIKKVTAWMPLPEPWKGENDEAD